MKLMYFLHQSLPHKLVKEDALFYWQFKTKWEELTVCIFFQLCYQGNVRFISSATSIQPSISLLPTSWCNEIWQKNLPQLLKRCKLLAEVSSLMIQSWILNRHYCIRGVFSIFLYCNITISFLDILGLSLYWLLDGYLSNHLLSHGYYPNENSIKVMLFSFG